MLTALLCLKIASTQVHWWLVLIEIKYEKNIVEILTQDPLRVRRIVDQSRDSYVFFTFDRLLLNGLHFDLIANDSRDICCHARPSSHSTASDLLSRLCVLRWLQNKLSIFESKRSKEMIPTTLCQSYISVGSFRVLLPSKKVLKGLLTSTNEGGPRQSLMH